MSIRYLVVNVRVWAFPVTGVTVSKNGIALGVFLVLVLVLFMRA